METPLRSNNRQNIASKDSTKQANTFEAPETPLLKKLGYGTGIGVYHLDRMVGRSPKSPWALKKVLRTHKDNLDYRDRLRTEASLLKTLNHPNIIGFRGFTFTDDGREILAMEECTISLGDIIEDRFIQNLNIFSADQITKVCFCIANALDYLHNKARLIHGDIKSHNILINGDFKDIKLCDFGVSIKTDDTGKALSSYVGTPCWTAPEALLNENVTTKADIFSLGLVIYEMIALHPPHLNDSILEDNDCDESFKDYDDDDENYGKRPTLPEVKFDHEYNLILDIYYSCTEQAPEERPSAKEIVDELKI